MGTDFHESARQAAVTDRRELQLHALFMIVVFVAVLVSNGAIIMIGASVAESYKSVAASQRIASQSQNAPVVELTTPIIVASRSTIVRVPQRYNESDEEWISRYVNTIAKASRQ
jgi:hypothetical protein